MKTVFKSNGQMLSMPYVRIGKMYLRVSEFEWMRVLADTRLSEFVEADRMRKVFCV